MKMIFYAQSFCPIQSVILYFILTVLLFTGQINRASEDGADLFIKACQYQGHNPSMIYSGYAEMIITSRVNGFQISDETKESFIADVKKHINDVDMQKKIIDSIEKEAERNRGKDCITLYRKKILFLGNESESGWRRFESLSKRDDDKNWVPSIIGFRYGNGKTKEKNAIAVSRNPLSGNTVLGKDFVYVEEFSKFGRLQGLPSVMAALTMLDGTPPEKFRFTSRGIETFKNMVKEISEKDNSFQLFEIKDEVQYDANHSTATVLESTYKGKATQRYWIDASRGYVCPKIQIYDPATNELIEEYTSSGYFLHKPSGLWFPQKYTEFRKNAAEKKIIEDCDYVIDTETFSLNQKIALKEFVIDVPENEFVVDNRNSVVYRSISNGELSVNDVDKLATLDWLENAGSSNYKIHKNERTNGSRVIFVSLGVGLIIIGLFRLAKKYFNSRTAVLIVFLLNYLGCSSSSI